MYFRIFFFVSLCSYINCQFGISAFLFNFGFKKVNFVINEFSFIFALFVAVEKPFKISLTISAKLNALEIAWFNLNTPNAGYILLTDEEPQHPYQKHELPDIEQTPHEIYSNEDNSTWKYYSNANKAIWTYGQNRKSALFWLQPNETNGWITTNTIFDNSILQTLNPNVKCYGYWAVYIDSQSNPLYTTCINTYATWMNDNKETIKRFKFRDLFILGTHDSGSFRSNFNSTRNETLVTKYSLTQVKYQKNSNF